MVDTARSQSAQGSAPNSAQGGRSNKKGKGRASSNTSRGGANSNRRGKPPRDSSSNQQQVVEDTDGSFPAATRVKRSFLPDFEPAETDEGCFICAEPVLIYALPSCGHKTCHVCFVRLRALYKKTSCTFCNQEFGNLPVVFTRDPAKQYADFAPLIGVQSLTLEETNPATQQSVKLLKGGKDDKLGIHFDDPELHQLTLALLAFNCPDPGCKVDCKGWQDLKMHAKSAHQRSLCDFCIRNMKIFAHEHLLFTPAQLRVHIERGDVNLSASDQKGFTGHPQCEFCRIRFYDNESLFRHLREAHEQCFICTQNGTGRDQYFVNYKELEQHFESAHFTCSAQICRDAKFVVFETAGELQAHEIQTHGEALSHTTKRAMKEARRLQVDFSYDSQSATAAQTSASAAAGQDSRARAEESERRARAREMFAARGDTEDGSSSDRLRSVPGLPASGRAARGGRAAFSGQLSTDEASRQAQRDTEQKARHAAVMNRVAQLTDGSDRKVSAFKTAVRTYRASECSAEDLLGTLWNLFDKRLDAMEEVVTELGEVLDIPDKAQNLMQSWESFQVIDSFPALAGGSSSSARPSTSVTHPMQPRKAAVSSRGQRSNDIWSRVQRAAGSVPGLPSNTAAYPGLPPSSKQGGSHSRSTAWSSSSSRFTPPAPLASGPSTPRTSSATPARTNPLGGTKKGAKSSAMDFPSLPSSATAAAKSAQMREFFNRPAPSSNGAGWGSNPSSGTNTPVTTLEPEPSVEVSSKKKGKQGKKQLLFTVGASGQR